MFIDSLLGRFSNDLAIDPGTANTLIYVKERVSLRTSLLWLQYRRMKGELKGLAVGKRQSRCSEGRQKHHGHKALEGRGQRTSRGN